MHARASHLLFPEVPCTVLPRVEAREAARLAMAVVPRRFRHSGAGAEAPSSSLGGVMRRMAANLACPPYGDLGGAAGSRAPARAPQGKAIRAGTLLGSLIVHLSLAVAAFALLPSTLRPLAERGGRETPIEVLVVGDEEATASVAGGRPVEISVSVPDVPEPRVDLLEAIEPDLPMPSVPEALAIPAALLVPVPDAEMPALPEALKAPPAKAVAPPSPPKARARRSERREPAKRMAAPPRPSRHSRGEGESATTARASARSGSGGAGITAGTAAMTSYRTRIVAHLTRYKTYPEQARDRGLTGRNAIRITLDRAGRVIAAALADSSSHTMLDAATIAAARRAQPFPPMPDGGPATFTLTIGLRYALN